MLAAPLVRIVLLVVVLVVEIDPNSTGATIGNYVAPSYPEQREGAAPALPGVLDRLLAGGQRRRPADDQAAVAPAPGGVRQGGQVRGRVHVRFGPIARPVPVADDAGLLGAVEGPFQLLAHAGRVAALG